MKVTALLLAFGITNCPAAADEIVLPGSAFERAGSVEARYRLDRPGTGDGTLAIEWTDSLGRLVDRRTVAFTLDGGSDVKFALDLGRAVAMRNTVRARMIFHGQNADERQSAAEAGFVASPPRQSWWDYEIVMWQRQSPAAYQALKEIGVSRGTGFVSREEGRVLEDSIEPMLAADLGWYVENIATDFYSNYNRYDPGKTADWRFVEAKARYKRNPDDAEALMRDPGLSDPAWLAKIGDRLGAIVRESAPYRPLYYSLADEPAIAQTSAFWDFDLSPASLAGMRAWLKGKYGSLLALNRQWGTRFPSWDRVMPMTTPEAMARGDENFSAWADFKAWMDVAFARAVRSGAAAVHAADPAARAAIEGAQMPGWGGWDYSRLAGAVDAMEIYHGGENVEIARSLDPKLAILTTSSQAGPGEQHRVWRELLRGSRGLILWDAKGDMVGADGVVKPRGRESAAIFAALRGGVGALIVNARRHVDPVAILYSPASFRTQWMLDMRPKGEAWRDRDADAENADNLVRASIRGFARAIEHLGLQHRFVSSDGIEKGALRDGRTRVLTLPWAVALSRAEAREIGRFIEGGGTVIADGEPGLFDDHSRRLAKPLLSDVFGAKPVAEGRFQIGKGQATYLDAATPASAIGDNNDAADPGLMRSLAAMLRDSGIAPGFAVLQADGQPAGDVESYVFRDGGVTILALQRDRAGLGDGIVVTLPKPFLVHDVLGRKSYGMTDRIVLALDPAAPTILAISDSAIPSPTVSAPNHLRLGETARLRLGMAGKSPAARHVLRIEVIDPGGRTVPHYSGKVFFAGKPVTWDVALAFNDPAGDWRIRLTDVLGGRTAEAAMTVSP